MNYVQLIQEKFFQKIFAAAQKGDLCIRGTRANCPQEFIDEAPPHLPTKPIIRDDNRFYLQRNWVIETTLLSQMQRLQKALPPPIPALNLSPALSSAQKEVIQWAATHCLTMVSGGPGTGKTFVAGQLVKAFAEAMPSLRVQVAAPTGKAAERLAQELPVLDHCEATTLHRLLKLSPGRTHIFDPVMIDADLILVDEASMIDAALFAHLFAAIPSGARLIVLGDADQLPPVQGSGVFADLCACHSAHLLHQCHRTENSQLQQLYEAARSGDLELLLPYLEPFPEDLFSWLEAQISSFCFEERPDPKEILRLTNQARILSPLRKGPLGVDALNRALVRRSGRWWAAPILLTGNDSEQSLYNGTAGIALGSNQGDIREVVLFDGRCIPLSQLPSFEFAFALSVHKSQGSEFERVICLLPPGSEEFGRKALYTAITRAKREIRLFGDRATLEKMLRAETRQDNGIRERASVCFSNN